MQYGPQSDDVTTLLQQMVAGDEEAREQLFKRIQAELSLRARSLLQGERGDHTLQTHGLISEAYLRLVRSKNGWDDRAHFFAVACKAMKCVLADYRRRRGAEKRRARGERKEFDAIVLQYEEAAHDLDDLYIALEELAALDPQSAEIIEYHFFGHLSFQQIAAVTGIGERQVYKRWAWARAWLFGRLK